MDNVLAPSWTTDVSSVVAGWTDGSTRMPVPMDMVTMTVETIENVETLVYISVREDNVAVRTEAVPLRDSEEWQCQAWAIHSDDPGLLQLGLSIAAIDDAPAVEFPLYPTDPVNTFYDVSSEAWENVVLTLHFLACGVGDEVARDTVETAEGFTARYRDVS